jgi:propionate CoA-transferase
MTFTVEAGTIGGFPASEPTFGAAINPEAIIDQPSQFDFYDGGGLDISFLGLGEVDSEGSVNVSCFGPRFNGVGGFINITQSTKTLVFCGTFTGQGLEVRAGDGLQIVREGATRKFVDKVHHLSFNGPYASGQGIRTTYVTERAVFKLIDGHLHLTEIAPGIDLQRDVLDQCTARLVVSDNLSIMDKRIFRASPMGIKPVAQAAQ